MTHASALAQRFRFTLLGGAVLAWVAALVLIGLGLREEGPVVFAPTPSFATSIAELLMDWLGKEWDLCVYSLLLVGSLLLGQWFFLRPRAGWVPELVREGRPMLGAVLAAAFVVALISCGFVLTLVGLFVKEIDGKSAWPLELAMAVVWALWAAVFLRYWRGGDRHDQLQRMTRRILAGSVLELLIAVPADAWAAKKNDCYCARGTYWGIVLGGAGLLWAFGPGVALLLVRERYLREKRVSAAS